MFRNNFAGTIVETINRSVSFITANWPMCRCPRYLCKEKDMRIENCTIITYDDSILEMSPKEMKNFKGNFVCLESNLPFDLKKEIKVFKQGSPNTNASAAE